MLDYQVKYWELQENKRANRAREALTSQSNAIAQQEADTQRQKVGNDLILGLGNLDVNRQNAVTNYRNALTNEKNAKTNQQNALINFGGLLVHNREANIKQQDANTREYEAGFKATESSQRTANMMTEQENIAADTQLKLMERNKVISEIMKNATQRSLMEAQTVEAYTKAFRHGMGGITDVMKAVNPLSQLPGFYTGY